MTVRELTKDKYLELCQNYILRFWSDSENGTASPSADDLAVADELVECECSLGLLWRLFVK